MTLHPAPTVCVLTSVHLPYDGRIFYRECRALAGAGYAVTLIATTEPGEGGGDPSTTERDGVTVLTVPRPARRLGRPRVWAQLYRHVRRLQPHIVHLHDPELLLLVPLLRLAARRPGGGRPRLLYDVHEYFVDSLAAKHWIPARLRPAAMALAARLEQGLVRGVDGIVCAVEEQTELYRRFPGPITVVRNLPLLSLFSGGVPHPALDVDGLRLLYVGVITPERGIGVLVEALLLLQQQGVTDVTLFLCGPESPPGYLHSLQAQAGEQGLADRIRWLGRVPQDRIRDYMANADVGMAPGLPTRQFIRPGISTKLFEYMLCGLPIISTDYPHRRRYLDQADCGLIVPPEDAAACAAAIRRLRDDRPAAQAMGARGRALVLEHYTWEREQARLLEFYRLLAAQPAPDRRPAATGSAATPEAT